MFTLRSSHREVQFLTKVCPRNIIAPGGLSCHLLNKYYTAPSDGPQPGRSQRSVPFPSRPSPPPSTSSSTTTSYNENNLYQYVHAPQRPESFTFYTANPIYYDYIMKFNYWIRMYQLKNTQILTTLNGITQDTPRWMSLSEMSAIHNMKLRQNEYDDFVSKLNLLLQIQGKLKFFSFFLFIFYIFFLLLLSSIFILI